MIHCTNAWTAYQDIGMLPPLVQDYITRKESLKSYYGYFPDLERIPRQIALKQEQFSAAQRSVLTAYLRTQYPDPSVLQQKHITRLSQPHTFTVTTAHQPNVCTGYLYAVYKVAQVIKTAKSLKVAYPDYHFVPVFFIGSEDHDTEELNHFYLHGQRFTWEGYAEERGAFGRRRTHRTEALIADIMQAVQVYPKKELLQQYLETMLGADTMGEAYFGLIDALFKEEGLLCVLPDDRLLKKSFISVFKADILEQQSIQALGPAVAALGASYKIQAAPRAINCFYLAGAQKRARISRDVQGAFVAEGAGLRWDAVQMRQAIERHPETFSPNVFLRPLFQEMLLPNLMYVGGGGELSYWLELKALFDHYGVAFPMLQLRNSFVILDEPYVLSLYENNHFTTAQILSSDAGFFKERIQPLVCDFAPQISRINADLRQNYQDLDLRLSEQRIHLSGHLKALAVQQEKKGAALQKKIMRLQKKQYQVLLDRRQYIKAQMFPQGVFQERRANIMPYMARYGQTFIPTLIDLIRPFEQGIITLLIRS